MSDNSANRNKGCVHPPKENICAIRKRSPSALGGTVGTRMKIPVPFGRGARHPWRDSWNQNENRGHGQQCPPHGLGGVVSLTRLPVSPELLAVTSLSARPGSVPE